MIEHVSVNVKNQDKESVARLLETLQEEYPNAIHENGKLKGWMQTKDIHFGRSTIQDWATGEYFTKSFSRTEQPVEVDEFFYTMGKKFKIRAVVDSQDLANILMGNDPTIGLMDGGMDLDEDGRSINGAKIVLCDCEETK